MLSELIAGDPGPEPGDPGPDDPVDSARPLVGGAEEAVPTVPWVGRHLPARSAKAVHVGGSDGAEALRIAVTEPREGEGQPGCTGAEPAI